jgi:hypothetical protein
MASLLNLDLTELYKRCLDSSFKQIDQLIYLNSILREEIKLLKEHSRRLEQHIVDYQEQVTFLEAIVESHPDPHDKKATRILLFRKLPHLIQLKLKFVHNVSSSYLRMYSLHGFCWSTDLGR